MKIVRSAIVLAAMAVAMAVMMAAPAAAQQDADAQELAAYRLTKEGLDRYTATMRALPGELRRDPRFAEMGKLQAELDRLQEKDDPTDADVKRMEAIEARLEQLDEATDMSMSDGSLADIEAGIRKNPALAAAIKAGGMTPREYAKFTLVLFQASMAVGMQKAGLLKELPKEIAPANLKFVEQYEQELVKLQKDMEALAPGGR